MNKRIQVIGVVSIIAMLFLLGFQLFWLNRVMEFKKSEYLNVVNHVMTTSVEAKLEEYLVGIESIVSDPPIVSVNLNNKTVKSIWKGDTTILDYGDNLGYLVVFRKVCYDLISHKPAQNIVILDSICKLSFIRNGINDDFILELIDNEDGKIIATTENNLTKLKKKMVSKVIELGLTTPHGLVVYFDMPYKEIFFQMIGVLVISFLFVFLLIVYFFYQLKIIMKQSKESKIREEFMNNLVHEMKHPLASVSNEIVAITQLGLEDLKPGQRDLFNDIRGRITRLGELVYNLLIVWKRGFHISWKRLNLRRAIDALVSQYNTVSVGKNVTIRVDYRLDVDEIEVDDVHFSNAINNLIENAIKYSGNDPVVEITCAEESDMLVLSVKDNGVGIPAESTSKVFDRYYRVPGADTEDVHGFGLGLSYVKQVVEAHGGVVRLESEPGRGTTFTVMIPLVKVDDETDNIDDND